MSQTPFDPGLQPERVSLAWQRTALALAVGSLVYGRIVAPSLGLWALVPVSAGLVVSGTLGWKASQRYRHHHTQLTRTGGHLADGALPAVLAAATAGAGLLALVVLLVTPR